MTEKKELQSVDEFTAVAVGERGMEFKSMKEIAFFSKCVIQAGFAPKDCKTISDSIVRIQMGLEVGMKPMQALQNIACINGRPAIWGKAIKGLIYSSGLCAGWAEKWNGPDKLPINISEWGDDWGWTVTVTRKGFEPQEYSFSIAQAKIAGIWGRNTWGNYPKDMLLHRAVGRAADGMFADVMGGMTCAEVLQDIPIEVDAEEISDSPSNLEDAVAAAEAKGEELKRDSGPEEKVDSDGVVDDDITEPETEKKKRRGRKPGPKPKAKEETPTATEKVNEDNPVPQEQELVDGDGAPW